jgi:DNA-binding NarL/FixJ family response regulator
MAIDGFALDLVVLVLEGGWAGGSSTWASGAWGVSARLTSTYRAAEVPVLAVSAGAGAGAVASCVAQGAQALFSLDHLPDTLRSLSRFAGDDFAQATEVPLPSQFRALVGLTASERRILFYLTEGWAAQDIADELVVSLTTVRSHIRSTLRKLGVRSQLAAVAIANSRDLEHAQSRDAS